MGKRRGGITKAEVAALEPGKRVADGRVVGLGLRRREATTGPGGKPVPGRLTWGMRYLSHTTGTTREIQFSDFSPKDLGTGRLPVIEAARAARALVLDGRDPLEERKRAAAEGQKELAKEKARLTVASYRKEYQAITAKKRPGDKGGKKPLTIATDNVLFDRYIIPSRLGAMFLDEVTSADVQRLHTKISKAYPTRANRVVALLSHLFSTAQRHGLCLDHPIKGGQVTKNAENKREKFLTDDEYRKLAGKLEAMRSSRNRDTADCLLLILHAGLRKAEAVKLRWGEVDLDGSRLKLEDSKTGAKSVPIPTAAVDLLRSRLADKVGPFVFPSENGVGPRATIDRKWREIRKEVGIEWCRIHDLRHSFGANAIRAGVGIAVLKEILGHKMISTTQRYAHVDDTVALKGAEQVGARMAAVLAEAPAPSPAPAKLRRVK